ncbi:carbohydrate ABC transporter permease [Picrophilus oshimae]|uniref:Glycerol-3-P ABC transporter permease protein n=1 Tax=Picrophilus torridus (strain ATCC 700027 / DSM 9790 / JCM 10055 / NBRC 100828 / KAW 2/3) TaxID=1122961 RepID=Q6L2X8_PICTO|nr:carbohydrate ABC transporter permease [Picrophilus oshimae]AAT42673.1 glycerol-3-P ABC transporter permease protein [Picrophilus oshimae DSM 9789]
MKVLTVIKYIVMSLLAILFIIPYIWLIVESVNPLQDIGFKVPPYLTIVAYMSVFKSKTFMTSFYNGLIQSLGGTAFSIIFAIGPAYIFSRKRFSGRLILLFAILFLTGFPVFSLLIPAYVFYVKTSLYNTEIGDILFLGVLNLPITIWILKNSFDQIPAVIEKAAMIDGASNLKSIFYIFLPLSLPVIAVITLLDFIINWGNFYVPYILLSSKNLLPIAVTIYSYFGAYDVKYNELAAASIMYTIPSIVLYIFAQKYLIKAFSVGGIKR